MHLFPLIPFFTYLYDMEQILYIGLTQAFFAGLLIALKKPISMANQVLAAWFFLICIEMIIVLINSNLIELYSIKVLPFTYGPLMFLYARMMTQEKPSFHFKYLWHFTPFVIFLIISLIFIHKPVMEGSKGFFVVDRFISLRILYGLCFFLSITAYSILTYVTINKHQRYLKTIISYKSEKYTLQWLIGLSVIFYLSYILVFIFGLIDILLNFMPFDPYELSFIGLTLFAFLYAFYGFNQPLIFDDLARHEHLNPAVNEKEKKYKRSGLKKKDVEIYQKKIEEYLQDEKPYLDRELTINIMSAQIGIPRHFITEIINNYMGKNFYFLINEYRIQEVKSRLRDPRYSRLTILAIAYDSGFNSKSAFNSAFKTMTGQTPSQYLKSLKKGQNDTEKDEG